MFGCLAVYVEDKIVLILRDKTDKTTESAALRACELITARDHRIGKVPIRRQRKESARKRKAPPAS